MRAAETHRPRASHPQPITGRCTICLDRPARPGRLTCSRECVLLGQGQLSRIGGPAMGRGWCDDCGEAHTRERRLRALRRLLPASRIEIMTALPCIYGRGDKGDQQFVRDTKSIGAVRNGTEWSLP